MSRDEEKKLIIQEVLALENDWVLKAIQKLLDINVYSEEDYSEEHKLILQERIAEYKRKPGSSISLEQFVAELKAEGKL